MKKHLDEYLKEVQTLNKQCSQYTEQIEKLKKDVRMIKIVMIYKLSDLINYFILRMKIYKGIQTILRKLLKCNTVGQWRQNYWKKT